MRVLKLTLQYDGTAYVGWQRQDNGVSIQGLIEDALAPIEGRSVAVAGAGRTDAGVHALGQVASLTLASETGTAAVQRALNSTLPAAIRVIAIQEAGPDFHARFSAKSKAYQYRIHTAAIVSPFDWRYVWHVPAPLDAGAMARASRVLVGTHDFAAFQAAGSAARSTERTIRSLDVRRRGYAMTIEVTGDGFLRHMVRTIAGTLVEIGAGRRSEQSLAATLASRDRTEAGPTAPPRGLFLVRVDY